ncbi:capsid protein [Lactobacillus amylovorus]|uniref:capsid protein n=1 Tax=Lactobacillus amylovorus TaxID=1604 RepID=UPI00201E30B2|nr:capsid protein [Lactobacillus amylovorus]
MVTYLVFVILGIGLIIWAFWYDKTSFKPEQKRNGKMTKPYHKRWWIWTIAVFMVIGGLGNMLGVDDEDDDADNSSAKTEQVKKSKPKKAKKAKKTSSVTQKKAETSKPKKTAPKKKAETSKPKKTAPKKKPTVSTADKEAAALLLLKKSYKGQAKVWFDADNKAFMIQPTSEDFKEELLDIVQSQDTDDWKQLTDSIDAVSRSLYKNVKLADFVSIVNPDNPDKVLYSSLNGKTAYDFLKDDE